MTIDTNKIKKPKKKNTTTIKEGPDGKLYTAEGLLVSAGEGMGMLSEKERMMIKSAIDKMGQTGRRSKLPSKVAKNKMTSDEAYTLKDGGEVKKYMGGGSVHKNKSNMITKRGWGASRKT